MKYATILFLLILHIAKIHGCKCQSCKGKVRNKYSFLDGYIDIQTVKQTKAETLNYINEINKLTSSDLFAGFKKTLTKNPINQDNKVPFYINFATINYILELIEHFIGHLKKTDPSLKKYGQKIKNLIQFASIMFSKIFISVVDEGEEKDSNDIIIPIRNKANALFSKDLRIEDSLTGYVKDTT